jgi:hypothetical protein
MFLHHSCCAMPALVSVRETCCQLWRRLKELVTRGCRVSQELIREEEREGRLGNHEGRL